MASLFDERMKRKRDWLTGSRWQNVLHTLAHSPAIGYGCYVILDCAYVQCVMRNSIWYTQLSSVITVIRDARDIMVHDINIRLIYIFYFCISRSLAVPSARVLMCDLYATYLRCSLKTHSLNYIVNSNRIELWARCTNVFDENFLQFNRKNKRFQRILSSSKNVPGQMAFKRIQDIIMMMMIINFVWIFSRVSLCVHFLQLEMPVSVFVCNRWTWAIKNSVKCVGLALFSSGRE